MGFRFIHTADLHLDSPLKSLALRDLALSEFVSLASRQVLSAIVDLALREQVDALLIAGDLYDSEQTSLKTIKFFLSEMARLHEAKIAVFLIRGNHDALLEETKILRLPENVHLFGAKAAMRLFKPASGKDIYLHGLSFSKKTVSKSFLPDFEPPQPEAINIGLMHTSLDGAEGHDDYAPCKIRDLQNSGFSYWALGHIHRRSHYSGATTIVMPGIPQGRDINEGGVKSVTLGRFDDEGVLALEERVVALAQFERLRLDIDDLDGADAIETHAQHYLTQIADQLVTPQLIARLTITGSAKRLWETQRDQDFLLENLREFGAAHGNIWLERLDVVQKSQIIDANSSDPVQQLRQLIAREVQDHPAFVAKVEALVLKIKGQLPEKKLRVEIVGQDGEQQTALAKSYIESGLDHILTRLRQSES